MTSAADQEERLGVLCEMAERVLAEHEFHSVLQPNAQIVSIYDCDGEFVMCCTTAMSGTDLAAALRYGKTAYERGRRDGERRVADGIRALINAAPLELTL